MKTTAYALRAKLPILTFLECPVFALWLDIGVLRITDTGEENTYAVDEFGHEFYTKDLPL